MQKLLFLFLFACLLPMGMQAQDGCCEIRISNISHITNPLNPCQVLISFDTYVDGSKDCLEGAVTTYHYGDGESGTSKVHTYDGPGPWEVCIVITKGDCEYKECTMIKTPDCEDPCCEVRISNISHITNPLNPCQVIISHDTYVDGSEECLEGAVTTYYYGDGEFGTSSAHTYDGPGPWEVCIVITKDDCEYKECTMIKTPDCEDPCCEVKISNISHITNPLNPCQILISHDTYVDGSEECLEGAVTTYYYGDGEFGTSKVHTYDGPGPWEVCIVITKDDCEYKACAMIETPDCEDPCCEVKISNISHITNPLNPCQILISHDTYVDGSEECLEGAVTTYYYGDGEFGTSKVHTYDGPGPWEVCIVITKDDCEYKACTMIETPDCEDPCCEVKISNISHITNPLNPCQILISHDTYVDGSEECLEGAVTTYYYGDGEFGTSSFHTYDGPGPWEVCIVITKDDCEYKACTMIETPDCEDPCCDIRISNISYITNPLNPCQILISHDTYVDGSKECLEGAETSYDYGDGDSGSSKVHTYDGPGPWEICITIKKDDCVYDECEVIMLPECLGFNGGATDRTADVDTDFGKMINIFPNPTTDYVNLTIDEDMINPPTHVRVMDVSGKLVYQQDLSGQSNIAIDLSTAAEGLYIVQFSNQNGLVATERLIKQK